LNKTFTILIFLCCLQFVKGQSLSGLYISDEKHNPEKIDFGKDSISFYLKYGCCLISELKGTRKYRIENKILFIENIADNNISKIVKKNSKDADTFYVKIFSDNSVALPGASVVVTFKNENKKIGSAAGASGEAYLYSKLLKQADSLQIGALGHHIVSVKYEPGFDYEIHLVKGESQETYREVLNYEKGLKIKIKESKILIRRPIFFDHKKQMAWVTYVKSKTP
jgi:hypothetical protein